MTLTKVPFRCNTTEESDTSRSPRESISQRPATAATDDERSNSGVVLSHRFGLGVGRRGESEAQDQGKQAHLIASESTTLLFPASRLAWSLNQTWIKRKKTRESHTECVIAVLSH
ncbi:hypothetical protein B296_00038570 [Ensete ventricosum]|uniref:Uncharacterized protein n=1 Tax=Ensete ventricosum TaxID=4639 RepID=A0A426Y2J3_ENSVE|nr:hypothetical protein B296_00038570 [Ensete ventricosum]